MADSPLAAFSPKVLTELLGRKPSTRTFSGGGEETDRALGPEGEWPRGYVRGAVYLHQFLADRLAELGDDEEAATLIRHELQDGKYKAVLVLDKGQVVDIPSDRFRGAEASRLWWRGRSDTIVLSEPYGFPERRAGDIFVFTEPIPLITRQPTEPEPQAAPEPEAAQERIQAPPEPPSAHWWPTPGQTMASWVMDPAVEREAVRRLKAAGADVTETAKAEAMVVMGSEAGREFKAGSIAATRRKLR